MIANIVLGMLLVWFTCVLVITIRAAADQREQDARASGRALRAPALAEESGAPLLAPNEPLVAQPEAVEAAVSATLTLG